MVTAMPLVGAASNRKPEPGTRRPVSTTWEECTLTRAKELESLAAWLTGGMPPAATAETMLAAIGGHLAAARNAAAGRMIHRSPLGARLERAMSNLDAAEADLLQLAPADFLLGQIPSLLNLVQRHLTLDDPRRQEFERLAAEVGCYDHSRPAAAVRTRHPSHAEQLRRVETGRRTIVSIVRGAMSAALREQLRVRSFRAVIMATAAVMLLLAVLLAAGGALWPRALPLCFQPEDAGQQVVVCPTGESRAVPVADGASQPQVDAAMNQTVQPRDLAVIELVGLLAASIAATAAIRGIRGSSEPHGLPVALAALKLPTGAVTAVLGLLLMRGGFVPGLSALDTPAQIVAWAALFGYAQQLFTRFIDQQANTVLNDVRGSRNAATSS